MKKLNIAILALIINCNIMAQKNEVEVPEGVIYNKTSERINLEAKELLIKELNSPEYCFFDKIVYCGPNLWSLYKELPIKKGNIIFKVPQDNGAIIDMHGKLIQTKNDFIILWDRIVKDFGNSNITIRKINEPELKYFWSIISYDIEEPLFVVDNQKFKLIIDFNKNSKILMLEAY